LVVVAALIGVVVLNVEHRGEHRQIARFSHKLLAEFEDADTELPSFILSTRSCLAHNVLLFYFFDPVFL